MELEEYNKIQFSIQLKIAEISDWFNEQAKLISEDNVEKDLSQRWARKVFDKVCLETYSRHLLSQHLIPEHQMKRIKQLMN